MIFLDMDGVICDFVGSAARLHCRQADELVSEWPAGVFDICHVLGVSATQFWSRVDRAGEAFWTYLNDYPWTSQLIELVQGHDEGFVISTSPSRSHHSSAGKVRWLQMKFGMPFRSYMLGEQKHLLAKPGAVLIDDNEASVLKFRDHGGEAILFPQPWNSLGRVDDPVGYVSDELNRLCGLVEKVA